MSAAGAKRETLIAPLGYMTTPNQYGVFPEGALAQAENVVMRNKGKLLTAPALSTLKNANNGSISDCYKLFPLDSGYVCSFITNGTNNDAYFTDGTTSGFANYPIYSPGSLSTRFPFSRTSPVRARDRMLVNSANGVMALDTMVPSTSGGRTFRWAGLPQVNITSWLVSASAANLPIPANIMVGYRAVATREYSDGYILKAVPSASYKYLNNNAAPVQVSFRVVFYQATLQAGDIIEVYRTDGLSTTSTSDDPGTTYKLIYRVVLTSTDISNSYVSIVDRTAMTSPFYTTSGRELYTNPYQEGETGANRQPDVNGAQAVFKGYTFYANLTERAQVTISVPAGIGDVSSMGTNAFARANGIGGRTGAGTVTNGNNVITGVSATDIVGVRVGQRSLLSTPFPALTSVTAVGTSTITMSAPANANASAWTLYDWIEGDLGGFGFGGAINGAQDIIGLFSLLTHPFEITTNQSVPSDSNVALTQNMTAVIEPSLPIFGAISIRASGGSFYSPPLTDITQTAATTSAVTTPNLMRWSKDSEPEHVPASNETRVGAGKIISLVSTKDALWIFCTDGIYRLSGDAGVWRVDVVAPGCVLCSPGCAVSMRDQVYAYTNYGFVAVTDSGVVPISDLQIKAQLPGPSYVEGLNVNGFLINNDDDEEVLIAVGWPASIMYVYNARQNAFTYLRNATGFTNMTAGVFQQNPLSGGSASVVLASTSGGGAPQFGRWGQGTQFLAPVVQYRNLYAKNPMSLKQWIDCTLLFEPVSSVTLSATINGFAAGNPVMAQSYTDSYATFGVPRQFAIAAAIQPGWSWFTSSAQLVFEGVSVRVREFTTQQVRR